MADVASSVRERGQLILIGGLSLAVVFVALALVLNSAIYTENLATRTSDDPADTAIQFRHDAVVGVGTVIDHANRNGDLDYSERYDEYQDAVDRWQGMHANYSAVNGLLTEVRAPDGAGNEGTLVVDDDGDYKSAADQTDWTVANDARVRLFRMNVDRDGLEPQGSSEFTMKIDDGASSWDVAIYEDSGLVAVTTDGPDGTNTCTAEGSSVQIDITGGTLDGTHCEALSFVEELSGTHDIRYSNADSIAGTYELTVDKVEGPFRSEVDAANGDSTYSTDSDGSAPYTTPAIYSATIELVYDGPSVTYETEVRVAPGEPGEPGESAVVPPMAQFGAFVESGPLSRDHDAGATRWSS